MKPFEYINSIYNKYTLVGDNSKTKSILGWKPTLDFSDLADEIFKDSISPIQFDRL